jgi:hypothetical protein
MLYIDAIAITRYIFIFWKKNLAIFQDSFWSFYINFWVMSFSFLSQSVHAYIPGNFEAVTFFYFVVTREKSFLYLKWDNISWAHTAKFVL